MTNPTERSKHYLKNLPRTEPKEGILSSFKHPTEARRIHPKGPKTRFKARKQGF